MIRLDAIRALHEHELAAYCAVCERWALIDLKGLIAESRGDYCFVGCKPWCSYCGGARSGILAVARPARRQIQNRS
jgi:hypothetical protein